MKKRRGIGGVFVLLSVVLLMAAALGGCGSPKENAEPATGMLFSASTPTTGMGVCVNCHADVASVWLTSRHANLLNGDLSSQGTPTIGQVQSCTRTCHNPNSDSDVVAIVSSLGTTARPVIGCETCHGPGSVHLSAGGTGLISVLGNTNVGSLGTTTVSPQFRTCTACHVLLDDGGLVASATSTPKVQHWPSNPERAIIDTHYAQSPYTATPGSWNEYDGRHDFFTIPGSKAMTGYWMDYADQKVCSNCHNPHGTASINREWAQSAHADPYGAKTGYWSGAWSQYNWSCEGKVAESCGTSGGNPRSFTACQRCHTTTGFMKYADAIRAGDQTTAEAIRKGTVNIILASGATDTSVNWKPQMLECNGCHTDNRGSLRNPGAITVNYDLDGTGGTKRSIVSVSYPDLGSSNVCMLCHVGRNNGQSLKGTNDQSLITAGTITSSDFSKSVLTNPHYLTAGATLFNSSGYEFDGRPYNDLSAFRHNKIGTWEAPGTGTSGPCVGCHMSRPNKNGNHLYLPVSRDETGVTGITSEVCFNCHGPSSSVILDLVKEQREEYHESIEALNLVLERRGIYFRGFSPYFFQIRTNSVISGATATLTSPTTVQLVSVGSGTGLISAGTSTVASTGNADYFRFDKDGVWWRVIDVDGATNVITIAPEFVEETGYTGSVTVGNGGPYTVIRGVSSTASLSGSIVDFRSKPTWYYPSQATDTDKTGVVSGKNNQGAALNFNLLHHDEGGYVHNRMYVKRLMYDAIDWMDDNSMNYSVGATLNALDGTFYTWKAGAMKYLLPNGIMTDVEAERP